MLDRYGLAADREPETRVEMLFKNRYMAALIRKFVEDKFRKKKDFRILFIKDGNIQCATVSLQWKQDYGPGGFSVFGTACTKNLVYKKAEFSFSDRPGWNYMLLQFPCPR